MFRPIGNKVIILPNKIEDKSVGGILIPGTIQDDAVTGVVVARNDMWPAPLTGNMIYSTVNVGDTVIYGQGSHVTKINVNGIQYVVVSENDLITIYKEEKSNG